MLVAAMFVAAREASDAPRRNVMFLTVDSLRADAMTPTLMPCLWKAALSSRRYTQHRAVSAWTAPNVISIVTGLSPFEQGVYSRANAIQDQWPGGWKVPLKRLANEGWAVAGTQAFMRADQYGNLGVAIEDDKDHIGWLTDLLLKKQPYVFWYHDVEVHLPYHPDAQFMPDWERMLPAGDSAARERMAALMRLSALPSSAYRFPLSDRPAVRALYEGDVRQFDAWFCGFWSYVERSKMLRDTLIVFTADHAEELAERGRVGHASTTRDATLHEEVLRIPLMIWGPGVVAGQVDQATDHLDIVPTVLAYLGKNFSTSPTGMATLGRNLLATNLPVRQWRALTSKAGFGEQNSADAHEFLAAVMDGPWKAVIRVRDEKLVETRLYNLDTDPTERRDFSGRQPEVVLKLVPPLLAATLGRRSPESGASAAAAAAPAVAPHWLFPDHSGVLRYESVRDGLTLRWSGDASLPYVLEYEAGEGASALSGEMQVLGTVKDFGKVERKFWDTYIVPYGRFRLRIGVKSADGLKSEWLDVRAEK